MGLDVYLYRLSSSGDSGDTIAVPEKCVPLFDESELVYNNDLVDIKQSLLNAGYGIDIDEVLESRLHPLVPDSEIDNHVEKHGYAPSTFYIMEVITKYGTLVIDSDKMAHVSSKRVQAVEIKYQRKQAKTEYYDKWANCWYAGTENYDDNPHDFREEYIIVRDNDLFNEIKKSFNDDAPIQKWVIGPDEFVYFSY